MGWKHPPKGGGFKPNLQTIKNRKIRGKNKEYPVNTIICKKLSYAIVGAAMKVHRILGSGFLEAVCQASLAHELTLRNIPFEQYKCLKVTYKGQ